MTSSRYWTQEEDNYLIKNLNDISRKQIAAYLGRTLSAINERVGVLGLTKPKKNSGSLSDSDINILKKYAGELTDKEIYEKFFSNKFSSPSRISRIRAKLRLKSKKLSHDFGDTYLSKDGYVMISGEKGKRRYLHVQVMEEYLGRPLTSEERVHHIDGNKENNSIDNLFLCANKSIHSTVHKQLEQVGFELIRKGVIVFQQGRHVFLNGRFKN